MNDEWKLFVERLHDIYFFNNTGFQAAGSLNRPASSAHVPSKAATNGSAAEHSSEKAAESHRGPPPHPSSDSSSQYIAKIREV